MVKKDFLTALAALIIVGFPLVGQSQFENLISPGDLSQAHESLKGISNCTKCHASAKGVPNSKCLSCHTEIKKLISRRKGYHARQEQACNVCHGEHKGTKHDLMGLSRVPFNHDDTGWPLRDAHAKVKCENCHTQKRRNVKTRKSTGRVTYLEASRRCNSCHKDIHGGRKSSLRDCSKCHTTSEWTKAKSRMRFSHTKETKFPLTGAHRNVSCYNCHKNKTWAPLEHSSCTNCHADPHKGTFGTSCVACHSTSSWKANAPAISTGKGLKVPGKGNAAAPSARLQITGGFDHQKTRFPLTGLHTKVTCRRCHGPKIGKMSNFEECSGCHKNPHGDQFEKFWSVKKTCSNCHVTEGFKKLSFNHDKDSRFKLEDKHTVVSCNKCHARGQYRWLQNTPDCALCHADVHKGQLSHKPCASCHSPKGFSQLLFDHNRDARFSLVGRHKEAKCESCHENKRYKGLPTFCDGCHNDFHNKELGNECARCHTPTSFKDLEFNHNREARFKLTGQHNKLQCNQCHVSFKYKLGVKNCAQCHRDVHAGEFGNKCENCHNTNSFKASNQVHNFGEFSLQGKHDLLECDVCHGPKAAVRPLPIQCVSCHTDPHMNSLGNRCYNCHTQVSWMPSTFQHKQTGFELSGAHRFLSCDSCHFNRVFGGLPQECVFCHTNVFQPPPGNPSHPATPIACDSCHFTFGWRPARL